MTNWTNRVSPELPSGLGRCTASCPGPTWCCTRPAPNAPRHPSTGEPLPVPAPFPSAYYSPRLHYRLRLERRLQARVMALTRLLGRALSWERGSRESAG